MQVRKQKLELDTEQTKSKYGKEYVKAVILSPCLFNFYAEYIMRDAGLDEAQAGIKIAGRITSVRWWHHPYGKKQRRTKESLDESQRGE